MRLHRTLTVLSAVCLLSATAFAQSTSTGAPVQPTRDNKAVAVVQAAIAAFGTSATAQSFQAVAQVQAVGPTGNQTASTVTWEMAGAEFRIAISDASSSSVLVTDHGNPSAIVDGATRSVPKHVTEAMFIPAFPGAILAREFQDQSYSIQFLGSQSLNGVACGIVRTLSMTSPNSALTTQVWYFSNSTNLPVRVTYRSPADANPQLSVPETIDLSNYNSVSGGVYPFQIVVHFLGKQVAAITLQSVSPNANLPPIDFDSPAAGAQ